MISKTFSIELETYMKINKISGEQKISTSKAVNTLLKLGFAYNELLKEQKDAK